jgi:gliding motility-associated-like protein
MRFKLILIALIINLLAHGQFGYDIIGNTFGVNINNAVCGEVDSCFTLTLDQADQSGAVWDNKSINLAYNFDASFCLTLGSRDEWGADGFAFVMRRENSIPLGTLGYGIGAVGISPSIAIEFDTWENIGFATTDIAADHTALYFNGDFTNAISGPTSLYPNAANAEDGDYHIARIVWISQTNTLLMYFDGNLRINYQGDIVNTIFGGNPIITWGFTASTGGVSNLQQICFPKYSIELIDEKKICNSDSTFISFYDPNITSYTWTFEDGTIIKDWNTLEYSEPFNLNDTIFYTNQDGYYYLNLEINNQVIRDSVKITVIPTPIKPFDKQIDLLCLDETNYMLNAQNPGAFYLWSTGESAQQISITNPGTYFVAISDPNLLCFNADTIKIISFCKDTSICEDDDVQISFYEEGITNYKWYYEDGTILKNWNTIDFNTPFNLDDTIITISEQGSYYLSVSFGADSFTDSLELTVIDKPEKPFELAEITLCLEEDSLILDAKNPGSTYNWSTLDSVQQITIQEEGIYFVSITEPILSCKDSDTIKIISVCETTITVPNVFSPNGDFINDTFKLILSNDFKWIQDLNFTVLNRWGQVIYQANNELVEWDGKQNGSNLSEGAYFYTLSYKDKYTGVPHKGHGVIQLIR